MNSTRPSPRSIAVEAPARLHMGFLDVKRGAETAAGRQYGGIGLAIEGFSTRLYVRRASANSASGDHPRVLRSIEILQRKFGLPGGVAVEIERLIPEHVGLGSGTQLALAVGCAVARLFNLNASATDVARLLGRGRRSGIGIGAFAQGGFLVDGGSDTADVSPPIVSRLVFPPPWRVLLVFDDSARGLHGCEESGAFRALPVFAEAASAHLCRLVLLRALPALQAANVAAFGAVISEVQQVIGDHFAAVQGGRYASPHVADALAWFAAQGAADGGQSSWGPTGFVIVENDSRAQALLGAAQARWKDNPALRFAVCEGRNRGGEIGEREREARTQHAASTRELV